MNKKIKKNKLLQKLFVRHVYELHDLLGSDVLYLLSYPMIFRYMYRRCKFLDNFPGYNFNQGVGDVRHKTDTTRLGSTVMKAMLKEAEQLCDYEHRHQWTASSHQQVSMRMYIAVIGIYVSTYVYNAGMAVPIVT